MSFGFMSPCLLLGFDCLLRHRLVSVMYQYFGLENRESENVMIFTFTFNTPGKK